MAAWLGIAVDMGDIQCLLKGISEFVCLVVWESKGCVRLGCFGVGKCPKGCVLGVMGYVVFCS